MANTQKLRDNTILITGGSSGIGLGLSKALLEMGNIVIICGRSKDKLQTAKEEMPQVSTIQCDISDPQQRDSLYLKTIHEHPQMNILINNAALVHYLKIQDGAYSYANVDREIQTNFIGPVGLMNLFLPHLLGQVHSAIINITTGLIYAPLAEIAGYCASKSALHSYTQSLRIQLRDTPLKVIEVMMTAVDTPFHDGGQVPDMAITRDKAVSLLLKGLSNANDEIRIGNVKMLRWLSRLAPSFALRAINKD